MSLAGLAVTGSTPDTVKKHLHDILWPSRLSSPKSYHLARALNKGGGGYDSQSQASRVKPSRAVCAPTVVFAWLFNRKRVAAEKLVSGHRASSRSSKTPASRSQTANLTNPQIRAWLKQRPSGTAYGLAYRDTLDRQKGRGV